jgi:hypothetical protein
MAFEARRKGYRIDPVAEMLESQFKAELAANTRFNAALKRGRAESKVEIAQKLKELGSTPEFVEAATSLKPGDY